MPPERLMSILRVWACVAGEVDLLGSAERLGFVAAARRAAPWGRFFGGTFRGMGHTGMCSPTGYLLIQSTFRE